jgi:hypothetical protein
VVNAYVFGTHSGDLPADLVDRHSPGDGVRAVVRLRDGEHDILYAVEAPDDDRLSEHIAAVSDAGTQGLVVLQEGSWAANLLPPLPAPRPMWLPPSEALMFVLVTVEDVSEFVTRLVESLGLTSVATWPTTDGRWLVEAVSDDADELAAAFDEANVATKPTDSLTHVASMSDLIRK